MPYRRPCGPQAGKDDFCRQGVRHTALWKKITARSLNRPIHDGLACHGTHPVRAEGAKNLPLLRAVAGPQQASFTDKALHDFTHSSYMLTPDCDRMACRLAGPIIETVRGSDILSDGIAAGSVQVSTNGQPIVMMADHQTTGRLCKDRHCDFCGSADACTASAGTERLLHLCNAAAGRAGARRQAELLQAVAARLD